MRFVIFVCFLFLSSNLSAQFIALDVYNAGTSTYSDANFDVCGFPVGRTFRIRYDHCPTGSATCLGGCPSPQNIRFTTRLYRDGQQIESNVGYSSNISGFHYSFYTYTLPGSYKASVTVERKRNLCIGWKNEGTYHTNTINVGTATPNDIFDINGQAPNPYNPVVACGNLVRMNAASTTCESSYYIGVEECNPSGIQTNNYSWNVTFAGEAPNNIDLQTLCANYSIPPFFTGNDASRQGESMRTGLLPSGQERHYRVTFCANPGWHCQTALVRITPYCESTPIEFDNNNYIVLEDKKPTTEENDAPVISNIVEAITEKDDLLKNSTIIKIIPHPLSSNSLVTIEGYTGKAPIQFEVYNSLGQVVMSQQSDSPQFDIQKGNLAAGIYVYRATAGETVLGTGKLSIQ